MNIVSHFLVHITTSKTSTCITLMHFVVCHLRDATHFDAFGIVKNML